MKSFQEFTQFCIEQAKLTPKDKAYKPKIDCYGKTVDYKMAPGKKVCAKNTSDGGGDEE
jgi:hypothetical protein